METNDYICAAEWKAFLMAPRFRVIYSDEVLSFLKTLNGKARKKILFNINKSKYVIDETLFKKLSGTDFWEFRTSYGKQSYRIFAFWDEQDTALVITTHGFVKKKQKTPMKEINRATSIKHAYYSNKQ